MASEYERLAAIADQAREAVNADGSRKYHNVRISTDASGRAVVEGRDRVDHTQWTRLS